MLPMGLKGSLPDQHLTACKASQVRTQKFPPRETKAARGMEMCMAWNERRLSVMLKERQTLAKGARQLVVQEALDTMGALGSYVSQFTPTTYVGMSEPLAGAVMSTCTLRYYKKEDKGAVLPWCS